MSEVTEMEAREAAAFLKEYDGDPDGSRAWTKAVVTLSEFGEQELARRDAEREERSLPIDAEWCLATLGTDWSIKADALNGAIIRVWETKLSKTGWGLGIQHGTVESVHCLNACTRGQLLDLLRALKGGGM